MESEPKRKRAPRKDEPEIVPQGIVDKWRHPDDLTLKDGKNGEKYHLELIRLLTCHCDAHTAQARNLVRTSFNQAAKGHLIEEDVDNVVKTYEEDILKFRHATWLSKEIDIVDFTEWAKKNDTV